MSASIHTLSILNYLCGELPMLEAYRHHVAERAALGIPPLPLSAADGRCH